MHIENEVSRLLRADNSTNNVYELLNLFSFLNLQNNILYHIYQRKQQHQMHNFQIATQREGVSAGDILLIVLKRIHASFLVFHHLGRRKGSKFHIKIKMRMRGET